MIENRLKSLLFAFLAVFACMQGAFAADGVTFATFNTGVIVGSGTPFTKTLDTSALTANEYVIVNVSADFVGTPGNDSYSGSMKMALGDGGSSQYWPASKATYGSIDASGNSTLKWTGVLPRTYTSPGTLQVKFLDSAAGPFSAQLNNVVVSIYPTATPKHSFAAFGTGTITSATAGFTKTLDVSGMPSTEYVIVNVAGDYVAGAAPKDAFSNTMRMELSSGGTVLWPQSVAHAGVLPNSGPTTLRWSFLLPKPYVGGSPLSVKFVDSFTDASGPYSSSISNVVVSLYPVPTPKKVFADFNTGTITSTTAGFTKVLDVTGMPSNDYVAMKITGDYVGVGAKAAFSNTMRVEITNGSSSVYFPAQVAVLGTLNSTAATTLTWVATLPKAYLGGTALSVRFFDPFTDATGPYTSSVSNVSVTMLPVVNSPAALSSLNRVNGTPSKAGTVNWTAVFSTPVTGVTASNFSLTSAVTGAVIGAPTTSDSGLTWNVPVTTGTGDGSLGLNLANATGLSRPVSNTLPFAGQAYVIDKTAPTVVIGAPSATLTRNSPVTYTVTYADTNFNSSTLVNANVTLNKTGSANGTVAVTGSGLTRTVTILGITGDGTLWITIAAGTATDTATNAAPAPGPSTTFTVDNTPPSITSATTAGGTYNTAFSYTIVAASAASFNATSLPGGLSLSGATISGTPTQAGSFTIPLTATDAAGNIGSGSLTLTIAKANATVVLNNLTQTYNGSARPITATTTPAGLTVNFTYAGSGTAPTNAGSYGVIGTISDTNYQGTASGTLVVDKASATVVLNNLTQTYNGSARPVTATTTPAGLTVNFTYAGSGTAPTNAGSYGVIGTISDTNYQGTASGTLVVDKATATVVLNNLTQTYNGSARPVTATTTPAGLTVNFTYAGSGTAPTNAGSYGVIGTISDTNYQGTASGTLVVDKATATVVLNNLTQTYNGSARPITATTTPAGLTVNFTYAGSGTAPTNAGSYGVIGTISDTNYQGSASNTLAVGKVQLNVTADSQSRAFGFANPTLTSTLSGFVGTDSSAAVSGAAALDTVANTASLPGNYVITAAIGTLSAGNYTFAFTNGTLLVRPTTTEDWKTLHFTAGELGNPLISGDSADADSDGIVNLLEFAFGTDPRNTGSGPAALVYTGGLAGGGSLTSPGQPIPRFEAAGNGVDFRVIFLRRNPATTGGISYIPEFSADLANWHPSLAIPTVLATVGDMQVVSVPYPLFVGGKKARYFHLRVSTSL